ncbi:MAG: hypothetical protein WCW67_08260 [Candidatus Margulisiibacteriota bacterium]|jgi:hypothetical protein
MKKPREFIMVIFLLALCGLSIAAAKKVEVKTLHLDTSEAARKLAPQLIYSGTNETISQALYNVDMLDGKIDEPHIVHKHIDNNHHILTFIGKNGEVKRVLTLSDEACKIDISIARNQRYAMVVGEYRERDFSQTTRYYDFEGNLLWEKKHAYTCYYVSPDGNFIIEAPGWDYQGIHLPRTYAVMNAKGEKLKDFEVKMDGKAYFGNDYQKFSENGKYCLMIYGIGGWQNNYRLVMVDSTGKVTFDKTFKGLYTNPYNTQPMNNGMLVYDYATKGAGKPGNTKISRIYLDNKEIYKIFNTSAVSVCDECIMTDNDKGIWVIFPKEGETKLLKYDKPVSELLIARYLSVRTKYDGKFLFYLWDKKQNGNITNSEWAIINDKVVKYFEKNGLYAVKQKGFLIFKSESGESDISINEQEVFVFK